MSVIASSVSLRTQHSVVNRPTSPTGLVQLEPPTFKRYRKRKLSFGSAIDLAIHNPSWIRNNIRMRECIRFTPAPVNPAKPDPEPDNPVCQCGNRWLSHDDRFQNNPDPKAPWKVETHTHTCATNAFGEIEFIGAAGAGLGVQLRKFVRVSHDIHPNKLLQLLNKQWNLGTPKLLISVTGGALNFHMGNKLKSVFRKGLIKAALSTGAWIITGGSNSGVMKYVGQAIRDYGLATGNASRSNVVAIGIASWGVIDQQDKLIHEKGRFPATYRMDTKNHKGRVLLDPNHTHFILADNGTVGKFGVEIKLRGKIEKEISEQKVSGNTDVSVPIVSVVVEGGPNTIATVYEAVMNGTPAVIVAGSGRAADILAFAFQRAPEVERQVKDSAGNIRKEKRTIISDSLSVRLAAMLSKEFGDADLDTHLTRIKEMLSRRHLITVYELGAGSDIDSAILHALLSANKGSVQDQLQLALTWNRVDVAKREIFIDDRDWTKGELDKALHYALVHNLVDFVKLFMENGVSLKDYLTIAELTSLYNEVEKNTLLYELLDKHRGKSSRNFDLIDVGKVIQETTMDTYKPLYLSDDFKKKLEEAKEGASLGSKETLDVGAGIRQMANGGMGAESTEKPRRDFYNPIRELFLFFVLQDRDEMARMLWEEGKEALAGALTASKILKSLASKEADYDRTIVMKLHAASYEEVALGVLNECYANNPDHTSLLLVREQENWGKTTNLSLAKHAGNRNFIAHSGVQNLLTEIWSGKLSVENNYWLVWLCSFIPPLIPCLINFREDMNDDAVSNVVKQKRSTEKKQSPSEEGTYRVVEGINEGLEMTEMEDATVRSDLEGNGDVEVNSINNDATSEDPLTNENHYHETANIDITNSGKKLSWWQRFSLFYNAPIITFRHNVLSYFVFLLLYSYIMLANFTPNISIFEYVLIVWVGSLYLEELRQIAHGEANSWRIRFWYWITDYWNMVDVATLLLFAIGIALRFFQSFLDYARIILAIDLAIFYIRILQIFSVSKNLGPKLIMIAKMMVDLVFFVAILCVFLVAYGVASQAILFPNGTSFEEVITGVFFKAYFQMYGELFLEEIKGDEDVCSDNATLIAEGRPRCPEYSTIGIILLAVYMMLSNVLLLNLLIAMFSYTFSAVQENTDVYWRFQRYDLIKEYFNRPAFVPPFIIIAHVFFLCRFLIQKLCRRCLRYRVGEMKQLIPESKARRLILWEAIQSDDYITKERYQLQSDISEQVRTTGERVEDLLGKMEEIFADPETGVPSKALGLLGEKAMEERLNRLEDQMERTNQAIDWIISSLRDHQLGSKEGPPLLKEIKPREIEENFTSDNAEDRKVPTTLEELGITLHRKARSSPYPGTAIPRFLVPDEKVPWEKSFHIYQPKSYTHESILALPPYADIDLLKYSENKRPMLNFNMLDKSVNYDRVSFMGHYNVTDGVPQNPRGRTGMIGRGLLGRFGPNHAADPIVTRWKKNPDGHIMEDNGQKVLEFVAIQRKDNQQWAIPGGMVEPGDVVSATLKREFGEEACGSLDKSDEEIAIITKKIEDLFNHGVEVYKGYVDDPRNTDNAWMETVAMNFHDEDGTSVGLLDLQAGDDAQGVRWQRVSSKIPLFASHQAMLRKVAELHNAAF